MLIGSFQNLKLFAQIFSDVELIFGD